MEIVNIGILADVDAANPRFHSTNETSDLTCVTGPNRTLFLGARGSNPVLTIRSPLKWAGVSGHLGYSGPQSASADFGLLAPDSSPVPVHSAPRAASHSVQRRPACAASPR